MKKLILFIICILFISIVSALEICEYEEDPYPSCRIITPAGITCSTYNLYHPNNSTNISDGAMGIVNADAGIYSVVFNGSDSGGWTIQLCDNGTKYINVKTTDETDLTTILTNQATIDTELLAINLSLPNTTADAVWNRNITSTDNQTAGGIIRSTWNRVMGIASESLIYDLLAELAGGYF